MSQSKNGIVGDPAVIASIRRGEADVLASRVTPRERVAREAGIAPSRIEAPPPAERAVVWSQAAQEVFLETIRRIAARDPNGAVAAASLIDRAAEALGHEATGRPGRIATTYEQAVPRTASPSCTRSSAGQRRAR